MLSATITVVVIRSRLWGMLPSWLKAILGYRIVRFALGAAPVMLLGLGLYYVEVSQLDANKLVVRPFNWVLTTGLGFLVNWLIFRERKPSKKASGVRYYLAALACSGCSFGLFSLLTYHTDLYYLLAQVITALAIGVPHYVVTNWLVFPRTKAATV